MAGGSPYEIFNIFGMQIQRYKEVVLYALGIYGGIGVAVNRYNAWKPKAPITFESPEEESYVKRYIEHLQHEEHKPVLLRTDYAGRTKQ